MDSLVPVAIIVVLILLNGLFVAAEFAIVGAPRMTIERLAAQGNRVARTVLRLLEEPVLQDRYIATAQLGITFASLGLGMYGEHVLAAWLAHQLEAMGAARWIAAHSVASVLAVAILTYFHIVVGEMVPKSLALQYADRTALRVTPAMMWITIALYPLVLALNALGNSVLRLFGIVRSMEAGHHHAPAELRYVIHESQEGGLLRKQAGQVLEDLFRFGELTAGEAMVPRVRVVGLPVDADAATCRELLRTSRHTRYPVYRGDLDHIEGVVHIKDLLRLLLRDQRLNSDHAWPATHVPESMLLGQVLGTMRRERSHLVVVMDEHGGTAGILTVEDLFEEVVGDIEEGVGVEAKLTRDESGALVVDGTVRLDELSDGLGRVIEHDEVETVSGLVLAKLGRAPLAGDRIEYGGMTFEVLAVSGHGVGTCRVGPTDDSAAPTQI